LYHIRRKDLLIYDEVLTFQLTAYRIRFYEKDLEQNLILFRLIMTINIIIGLFVCKCLLNIIL